MSSDTVTELWFSNSGEHQSYLEGLAKRKLLGPPPGILTEVIWDEGWESAFLTNSLVILIAATPSEALSQNTAR